MRISHLLFLHLSLILTCCAEKTFDPDNPQLSYSLAKEPYDGGNYDMALKKLGEFKARFPYSHYATEAEIMIANCYFELGQFPEASSAYSQFTKLHPKHKQVPFALFRVGLSYWKDAPEEIDREQNYTAEAIEKWEKLLQEFPNSQFSKEAREFIHIGQNRMAKSEEFIANFYCKQGKWHSCAYRNNSLARKYPQFKDIKKRAYLQAAYALENLASEKTEPEDDSNLYYRHYSQKEILELAKDFKKQASQ